MGNEDDRRLNRVHTLRIRIDDTHKVPFPSLPSHSLPMWLPSGDVLYGLQRPRAWRQHRQAQRPGREAHAVRKLCSFLEFIYSNARSNPSPSASAVDLLRVVVDLPPVSSLSVSHSLPSAPVTSRSLVDSKRASAKTNNVLVLFFRSAFFNVSRPR